ncbi:hypothetical protein LJR219_004342 [Phenylobacterium sp. LjRoot219]|uniref:hypothetical protein n=1 Tax=Phenylobacterium sp. LjRoot219 TaxID=3342283 RepID=UPI003ECE1578
MSVQSRLPPIGLAGAIDPSGRIRRIRLQMGPGAAKAGERRRVATPGQRQIDHCAAGKRDQRLMGEATTVDLENAAIVESKRLSEALELCRKMKAELPPLKRLRKSPSRRTMSSHMF